MAEKITPRAKDYSQWYLDVVQEAGLADNSDVRGCMVIKPHGYAIWEKVQRALDRMFKDTGHVNAYFPLFIPKSFLSKEAEHVEGFAKECAVVTHYRLKAAPDKKGVIVDPEAKLEEELIVRPTSETIIWNSYKGWIQSWRDLPILVNQWANVVRWEMRTRLFLRTAEFLWQEGHTAHATEKEAEEEAHRMLEVYRSFAEDWMAMPVYTGRKSDGQKFAGAVYTLCIEAMMQDLKALQAGTSHHLGQNFPKAFDVKFQGKDGKLEIPHATSWGVSTRLIGGLVMTHSDDNGLVLPPRLAPIHVVIVPIFRKDAEKSAVIDAARQLRQQIEEHINCGDVRYPDSTSVRLRDWLGDGVTVMVDERDQFQPGYKFAEWEVKGVPIRIEIGPKDLVEKRCVVVRRDVPKVAVEVELPDVKQKTPYPLVDAPTKVAALLVDIQKRLYAKAKAFRDANTHVVDTYADFKAKLDAPGGFFLAHWDGTRETEDLIAAETKATIRCIPSDGDKTPGQCMVTGRPSKQRVIFARSY